MGTPRLLAVGVAGLVLSAVLLVAGTGLVSAMVLGSSGGGTGDPAADRPATTAIPAAMLALYVAAAATCPGLPWNIVAAIGTVESGNDTSDLPGVHSGSNAAGAEGPMQFEPATFAAYDEPVPPGGVAPPSPYDPVDAVYAAARMLCADGAENGANLDAAVFAYNHDPGYVARVMSLAQSYGETTPPTNGADTVGEAAVVWALAQVGTPYIWGGETPGVGFDCSGLTQAAFEVAGVTLPRVAQDQFDAGPPLGAGTTLEPGDLVFFGGGPRDVTHVGLYLGVQDGRPMMVDAPHSGATVRVEAFPTIPGAEFGDEVFVGATRPAATTALSR